MNDFVLILYQRLTTSRESIPCLIGVVRNPFFQEKWRDRCPFEPLNGHAARERLYGAVSTDALVRSGSDKQAR